MGMVTWIDDSRFRIGDTKFLTTGDKDWNAKDFIAYFAGIESTADRFVVWKPRAAIDRYALMLDRLKPKYVVELGIMKGGSTAFLAAIAQPQKLVAIDVSEDEVTALDEFVRAEGLDQRLRAYYGVDQSDRQRLESILEDEFRGRALDLVVDDASHRLDATRASFNLLFPRLRPGGLYVIEDWSWAHALQGVDLGNIGPPLTRLVFELTVACAAHRDAIASVEMNWNVVTVTRGETSLDHSFDVAVPLASARAEGLEL
jgi:SAM-dependent methyltransferase